MVVIGIPLGVMCAVKQYTAFDSIINILAKFMGSIPGFWLGLMLLIEFSINRRWFPIYGIGTIKHWVLPVFTLLLPFLANYVRQVRSAMLDCIRQDYVRTARSKGAKESRVIFREALKNALLPIITLTGGIFATMIGGAVLVEKVFAIPGVGFKIVEAINTRDIPTLLACTMILAVFTIIVQLVIDLSYALVDPRIRGTFATKKNRAGPGSKRWRRFADMAVSADTSVVTTQKKLKRNSQGREVWERLKSRPTSMIALFGVLILIFVAIFADLLIPYEVAIRQVAANKLLPPGTPGHLLGTDHFGRDMLARIIHGARTALLIGVTSAGASLLISTILACLCAMFGGWVDNIIMRVIDVISCIPGLVVALAICAALGNEDPPAYCGTDLFRFANAYENGA